MLKRPDPKRTLEFEGEEHRAHDECVGHADVPFNRRMKKDEGDKRENDQRDAFLQHLKLRHTPFVRADAIGGYLENVFEECQAPASQDDDPERLISEFQMPVPSQIHEHVRDCEQNNRFHFSLSNRARAWARR